MWKKKKKMVRIDRRLVNLNKVRSRRTVREGGMENARGRRWAQKGRYQQNMPAKKGIPKLKTLKVEEGAKGCQCGFDRVTTPGARWDSLQGWEGIISEMPSALVKGATESVQKGSPEGGP